VLVIDETGVSLDGHQTAHVSRQYLANLGKIDNGVVSVSSLWADERVSYPVEVEPCTPAQYEASGKQDPAFRTKLVIARQLRGGIQRMSQGRCKTWCTRLAG
jgi:SRSO17 transposase